LQEKLNVGNKDVFKAGSALAAGVAKNQKTKIVYKKKITEYNFCARVSCRTAG
jgi:hypothetical protein